MKSHGVRRTPIVSIKFERRPVNEALKDSIAALGLLEPVGVNLEGQALFGIDRLVACEALGMDDILAHHIDADPSEVEVITLAENAHRRDLTAIERKEAIANLAAYYRSRAEGGRIQDPPHEIAQESAAESKKGAATMAAEAAGVEPRTARTAVAQVGALTTEERRALKEIDATDREIREVAKLHGLARTASIADLKRQRAAKDDPEEHDATGPIDEVGNALPRDVAKTYRQAQKAIDHLERNLVAAESALRKATETWLTDKQALKDDLNGAFKAIITALPNVDAKVGDLLPLVGEIGKLGKTIAAVRQARPHAVCPRCKALPSGVVTKGEFKGRRFAGRAGCEGCGALGWVGRQAHKDAGDVLTDPKKPRRVMAGNKAVLVSEIEVGTVAK